ncbi:MAG: GNAT family N-acetyltransferase [Actinomycetota bacterium]|nr:GNAT family N-acetyltransferase [Actinomycetota bacterium]
METHERFEARRLEETQRGTSLLARRPLIIFDDARATAVAATRAEAPELVAEVGRLRSLSFANEAEATGEGYGLDEYDDYYRQLVVIDKESGDIMAGTRLGFGNEILATHGWQSLYTAGYWAFGDGMVRTARRGVEIGRTWVHPVHRRGRLGLALLWKALALLLDEEDGFFFGMVSLTGYPERSRDLILNYLRRYHGTEKDLVSPRYPAQIRGCGRYAAEHEGICAEEALRRLGFELKRSSPDYRMPALLRHYARFGAELAGGFAGSRRENKVSALLLAPVARLRGPMGRFGSL